MLTNTPILDAYFNASEAFFSFMKKHLSLFSKHLSLLEKHLGVLSETIRSFLLFHTIYLRRSI